MIKHLSVKIFGRVQGVFFRYFVKEKADELGIVGFARNESDGAVYIEAEGKEDELNEFLEWCRRGPETANIEKLDFKFESELKNFNNFSAE